MYIINILHLAVCLDSVEIVMKWLRRRSMPSTHTGIELEAV